MVGLENPEFASLIRALITIGAVYLVGVATIWIYSQVMVTIAQGTLKRIRDDMFTKMQKLPIGYFDTHSHGDIMSLYTNDTDTLRQMIAHSLANLLSSIFTIVAVFVSMLYISVWLTLIVLAITFIALIGVKNIAKKSGKYFVQQQKHLQTSTGILKKWLMVKKLSKSSTMKRKTNLSSKAKTKLGKMRQHLQTETPTQSCQS